MWFTLPCVLTSTDGVFDLRDADWQTGDRKGAS